ncbi:hypothetical protein EAE89_23255 [Photorhabdus heterorhabditis]|nr:hypothetical protein [Photorhabdus heterorhabditis]
MTHIGPSIIIEYKGKNISTISKNNYLFYRERFPYILVIFQVASLLAALAHPGHIVSYAPGDSLPCRRETS